jgi:hypothetical protein
MTGKRDSKIFPKYSNQVLCQSFEQYRGTQSLLTKHTNGQKNLLCLRYQASSGCCFRKIYNCGLERNLVAVSWTRQPSAREDLDSGKYSVLFPCEDKFGKTVMQRDTLDVRNSVLDRVVSYLEARMIHTLDRHSLH